MPSLYDVAGGQRYPEMRDITAKLRDQRAIAAANEATARIQTANADYYEGLGTSEAQIERELKNRQAAIDEEENRIQALNVQARFDELARGLDQDERKKLEQWRGDQATAYNVWRSLGGDEAAAATAQRFLDEITPDSVKADFAGSGESLLQFNPSLAYGIGMGIEPGETLHYIDSEGNPGQVSMADPQAVADIINSDEYTVISRPSLQATTPEGITGDNVLERQNIGLEIAYDTIVDQIETIKAEVPIADPQSPIRLGATGFAIINLQSAGAQIDAIARSIFSGDDDEFETVEEAAARFAGVENVQETLNSFTGLAAGSAALKRNLLTLAVMDARLYEDEGRLSDFDVQIRLESMDVGGVEQLHAVLNEILRSARARIDATQRAMARRGINMSGSGNVDGGRQGVSSRQDNAPAPINMQPAGTYQSGGRNVRIFTPITEE